MSMSWAVRMDHAMVNAYKSIQEHVMDGAHGEHCFQSLRYSMGLGEAKTMSNSTKAKKRYLE